MARKTEETLASREDLREALADFQAAAISGDKTLMAECLTAALVVWFAVRSGLSQSQSIAVLCVLGELSPEAVVAMKSAFFTEALGA